MIRELILALDVRPGSKTLRFLGVARRGGYASAGADLAWMQQAAGASTTTPISMMPQRTGRLMYNLYYLKSSLAVVQGAPSVARSAGQLLLRHGHQCDMHCSLCPKCASAWRRQ